MSTKIFLLNVHSDRNAGDLALSRVTIEQLQTNFPGSQITLSMNDPESYKGELTALSSYFPWLWDETGWHYGRLLGLLPATLIPLLTWRLTRKPWLGLTPAALRRWIGAYLEADLVVSTAGGFYRSSGKGLTLFLTFYSLALAILAGKPLYFFPQSIGPFSFGWERWLTRWLFTHARIVMAREPISVKHLKACQVPEEKYVLLPDVAFGFQGQPRAAAVEWLHAHGLDPEKDRPLLGMTVIDWAASTPGFTRQAVYEEAVLQAIQTFVHKYHGKVLLLPQTWGPTPPEDDRITARRLAARLPELCESILVIEQPLDPALLQAMFGEMDLVIGTRMHSNIFSVSRGVPVIPIGYLHKSMGIAEVVGLEQWVIEIDQVDADILTEKLTAMWGQREQVREYLKVRIPAVIVESQRAGKMIAEDYHRLCHV